LASSALKIYISNVMTQPGETDGYTAYEHIKAIIEHSSPRIIDYCVVNSRVISQELLEKYQQDNSFPVLIDIDKIRHAGYRVIEGDLVNSLDYVRHDSEKLAKIVVDLIQENF